MTMLFVIMRAVLSSAVSTCWPSPVWSRWRMAAITATAPSVAEQKSTNGADERVGWPAGPDIAAAPDIAWARPSKPTRSLHGPPDPNTLLVARMMSGLTSRASRSRRPSRRGPRRHVGDHDVGGGDEATQHVAARRLRRVQRHAPLVAADLEEQRTRTVGRHRRHEAVLGAVELLDADDVGAEVGQVGGQARAGDVPAEVEHPDVVQNAGHRYPLVAAVTRNGSGCPRGRNCWECAAAVHEPQQFPSLRYGADP